MLAAALSGKEPMGALVGGHRLPLLEGRTACRLALKRDPRKKPG